MKVELRRLTSPSEFSQAEALEIREIDKITLASTDWRTTLKRAIKDSKDVYGAFLGEELLAVGGVVEYMDVVVPWFVGNEKSHEYPLEWCRWGRRLVKELKKYGKPMVNYIYKGNPDVQKWLRIIGFTVHSDVVYKKRFYKYTMEVNV